jgi:hypothetical protein
MGPPMDFLSATRNAVSMESACEHHISGLTLSPEAARPPAVFPTPIKRPHTPHQVGEDRDNNDRRGYWDSDTGITRARTIP